jgi:hypothetical protein
LEEFTFDLTWKCLHSLFSVCCTSEEEHGIWTAAQAYAGNVHVRDEIKPAGNVAILKDKPNWSYLVGNANVELRNYMINCFFEGMRQSMHRLLIMTG